MEKIKISDDIKFSIILRIVAIILLMIAILPLPYDYYKWLRGLICLATIYTSYIMYTLKRKIWLTIYIIIILIFNPVIPFYSEKGIWVVIDLITAFIILISLFITRAKGIQEEETEKST